MSGEKKPNLFRRIARWFRETKSELKKVVWPTRKQLINNTAIVLAAVITVGAVMSGMDFIFMQIVHRLLPFITELF
jgi:preprotein translocase subunit SecE